MADSTVWWLICGIAVAAELITGTFYLLMLALGFAAAALGAHAGLAVSGQITTAALIGSGAVVAWHVYRKRADGSEDSRTSRDVNLDIGEIVQVTTWLADGSTQVKYRGASWQAIAVDAACASPGAHRIVEVRGSQLVLEKTP